MIHFCLPPEGQEVLNLGVVLLGIISFFFHWPCLQTSYKVLLDYWGDFLKKLELFHKFQNFQKFKNSKILKKLEFLKKLKYFEKIEFWKNCNFKKFGIYEKIRVFAKNLLSSLGSVSRFANKVNERQVKPSFTNYQPRGFTI